MTSFYDITPNSEVLRIDQFAVSCNIAALLMSKLKKTYDLLGQQVGCINSRCFQNEQQTQAYNVTFYLEWQNETALRQGIEQVKSVFKQQKVEHRLLIKPLVAESSSSLPEPCLFKILVMNRVGPLSCV